MKSKKTRRVKAGPTVSRTVTCMHCRYERPAADERCHICGYPWPWAVKESATKRK